MYEVTGQTDPEGVVFFRNVTTAGAQDGNLAVIDLKLPRVRTIFEDVSLNFNYKIQQSQHNSVMVNSMMSHRNVSS